MYQTSMKSFLMPKPSKTYRFIDVPEQVFHQVAEKLGLKVDVSRATSQGQPDKVHSWCNDDESILLELSYGISFTDEHWTKVKAALVALDFDIEL